MAVNKTCKLAQALSSYYLRQGKKIVFVNKMTLNQLALAMWERLGYQGIDASVLSKVINGKRLFTIKQLEVFCQVLGIDWLERKKLKEILFSEIFHRHGVDYNDLISLTNLNLIEEFINLGKQNRLKGGIDLAIEIFDFLISNIIRLINEKDKNIELKKIILTELFYEKANCFFAIAKPYKAEKIFCPLIKEIRGIGLELKDDNIIALSYLIQSDTECIKKNYLQSANLSKFYLNYLKNPEDKLRGFRILGLDYGYLNDKKSFFNLERNIYKELEKKEINNLTKNFVLEGVARGKGLLRLIDGLYLIENIEKEIRNLLVEAPFQKVEILRSKIEIMKSLKMENCFHYKKIKKEAINLATSFGFERHKEIIKNL